MSRLQTALEAVDEELHELDLAAARVEVRRLNVTAIRDHLLEAIGDSEIFDPTAAVVPSVAPVTLAPEAAAPPKPDHQCPHCPKAFTTAAGLVA